MTNPVRQLVAPPSADGGAAREPEPGPMPGFRSATVLRSWRWLLLTALFLAAPPASAESVKSRGPIDVHYIAFPALFLDPDVAESLRIVRASDQLVLNVSLRIQREDDGSIPGRARVAGKITNLLGQVRELRFREIQEPGAIYYIAQARFTEGEFLRFALEVLPEREDAPIHIDFEQQFHVD